MSNRNFILTEEQISNLINAARASLHEELFPDAPAPEPLAFDGNYNMSLDDILVEECGCLPLYDTDCGNWPLPPHIVETLCSRYTYLAEAGEDLHKIIERNAIRIVLATYELNTEE